MKEGGGYGDGLQCQQANIITGSWSTTESVCLCGLHSICFKGTVYVICAGAEMDTVTHCFIVYTEEQCFRMFARFVLMLTLVLMQFSDEIGLINLKSLVVELSLSKRCIFCVGRVPVL